MVRFQCVHCGGRIAVQDRQLNRVARCPDCGALTHPLAQHMTRGMGTGVGLPPTAKPAGANGPSCDNCGQPLGKLQKPFSWRDHFVCGMCLRALKQEVEMEPQPRATTGEIATQASVRPLDASAGAPINGRQLPLTAHTRMPDFAPAFWGACLGLCVSAAGLYVVVVVLQSLSWMIVWGGIVLGFLASAYWIRRGIRSLRAPRRVRQVRAIVRD